MEFSIICLSLAILINLASNYIIAKRVKKLAIDLEETDKIVTILAEEGMKREISKLGGLMSQLFNNLNEKKDEGPKRPVHKNELKNKKRTA